MTCLCLVIVVFAVTNPTAGWSPTAVAFLALALTFGLPSLVIPSAGVWVEDGELFTVQDRWFRSQQIAWHDVTRFRVTDDCDVVAVVRDGSTVRVISGRARWGDELQRSVLELNAILEQRTARTDAS